MSEETFDYKRIIEDLRVRYEKMMVVYEARIEVLENEIRELRSGTPYLGVF